MKYQLINGSKNDINNFLQTVLENRNITDIDKFKESNTTLLVENTYNDLDNIDEGVELLLSHINKKSKTTLVVDPDVDGITSSAILYNYLKEAFGNIDFITPISHSGKGHGLTVDIKIPEDTEFIIIPDAGSNDYEQLAEYRTKNVDILIIDHHMVSRGYSPDAVVINNQLSENYSNKDFSGVGVVYRFLQALDERLMLNNADKYLDLVAIGLISDVMDTTSYETRYFIQQGLKKKNLRNPFLKQLLKFTKQSDRDIEKYMIALDVSFGIAPTLNATMRFGTAEEKLAVFNCFISTTEELENLKAGKKVFDMCTKNKVEQNENKRESSNAIIRTITKDQIKNDKILIINATDIIDKSLTGLTAMELANTYQRPVLIGTVTNGVLSGSARNYSGFPCEQLKDTLDSMGLFDFLEGHEGAFGYAIKLDKVPQVIEKWNEQFKDTKIEGNYAVDFILDFKDISNTDYYLVNTYRYLWGTGVPEPLFAITNIPFYPSNIKIMGEKKNTVKYEYQGKGYIKFNLPQGHELLNLAENYDITKSYLLNVVGKVSMNYFAGRTSPLVMIEDYEIIDATDEVIEQQTSVNVDDIWGNI